MVTFIRKPGLFRHTQGPLPDETEKQDSGKTVTVLFTQYHPTLCAIRESETLAFGDKSRLRLIALQTVPYALPLETPDVPTQFYCRLLWKIISKSAVDATFHVYLCRETMSTLRKVLPPHSLVVIGVKHGWWHFAEKKLAHRLRRSGYEVILVDDKGVENEERTNYQVLEEVFHV
jgi:hypothetical protein